jgi:hypothetical protein
MMISHKFTFPLLVLLIGFILNCTQATDSASSKDTASNEMLARLVTTNVQTKGKDDNDKINFEKSFENIYLNPKIKEYYLKLANKVLLETSSKSITLSQETIPCIISGNMKITTSLDLTILTSTDKYNKTAEISNEKKTIVFENCSNNSKSTIKSGTMTHTQTTKSKLTVATTSTTLTETITEGVETTDGTKVVTHVTRNGNKDATEKNQTSLTTTKKVNTYQVDSTNSVLTSFTPVSLTGQVTGQITHTTSSGETTKQINKTISKTY